MYKHQKLKGYYQRVTFKYTFYKRGYSKVLKKNFVTLNRRITTEFIMFESEPSYIMLDIQYDIHRKFFV